jgi:hypothetical protein
VPSRKRKKTVSFSPDAAHVRVVSRWIEPVNTPLARKLRLIDGGVSSCCRLSAPSTVTQ